MLLSSGIAGAAKRDAEDKHAAAAAGFVRQGDIKRATMELDEAITSKTRDGRVAEAQQLFDTMQAMSAVDGSGAGIPWRTLQQRAVLFVPVLSGAPYPFDPAPSPQHSGTHVSAYHQAVR